MAGTWKDRLSSIGQNLLTLEINTVVTTGLSAQKMPEVPLALHTLVQTYADYLAAAGFSVSRGLLDKAAIRVSGVDEASTQEGSERLLRELQSWPFPLRHWTDVEHLAHLDQTGDAHTDDTEPATDLTNGAETFEALQWAAWAALQTMRAGGALRGDPPPTSSVLSRINANCRQLKEAALRLEHQHGPQSGVAQTLRIRAALGGKVASTARLRGFLAASGQAARGQAPRGTAAGGTADAAPTSRLFGATVEETARALFDHPRPVFTVDPDVTILIRKAWDVGVQRVSAQTVIQVDGDLLQVIGDLRNEERDFLTQLHKAAVKDAVAQWHALFDVVRQLAGEVGRVVFGA